MPEPTAPAVSVRGLVKVYGGRRVVDGVDFSADLGAVTVVLGPNGAGKTTTLEAVAGFRRPDGGTVRVLGRDPIAERDAVMADLGMMLQEGGAYQAATPREMVSLVAAFHRDPLDPAGLLDRVGLSGQAAGTRFRVLSGGQKQRLNLALALVGRPRVVLLDEPTAGMDPAARRDAHRLFAELRDDGVAVMLTTHDLAEAETLADRVVVIAAGRVVADDAPHTLADAHGRGLVVTTPGPLDSAALSAAMGADVTADGPGRWRVAAGPEALPAVTAWFAEAGVPLRGVASGGGLADVLDSLTEEES